MKRSLPIQHQKIPTNKKIYQENNSHKLVIQKLTQHYRDNKFDEISKLPMFQLIEYRDYNEDKTEKRDCIWYVAQKKATAITGLFSFSEWQPEDYCQIVHPKKGDLVIYHCSGNGAGENHIGIYKGKNRVESKFGYGHIYNHPVDYVPANYGPYVSFEVNLG